MKTTIIATLAAVLLGIQAGVVLAREGETCLGCHTPAEDWEGMSMEEILEQATKTSNRMHRKYSEMSEEQLRAIIADSLPQE